MDFSFTIEQEELRRSVRRLAHNYAMSAHLRVAMQGAAPFDRALWGRLCGLGVPGLALAESNGGAGASWVELGIALEEAGRALMAVPLLSTVCVSAVLEAHGSGQASDALMQALAAGSRTGALAHAEPLTGSVTSAVEGVEGWRLTGRKLYVLDGGIADVFLVTARTSDEVSVFAVTSDGLGVQRSAVQALDLTRGQGTMLLTDAPAVYVGGGSAAAYAAELWMVALALESVGAARRCLEMTLEHLKTRVQFGRPIGSFQALKHRVADLAVELEAATSAAYYAAWAASAAPEELPIVAPVAALTATTAFTHIAGETIQLHGGIGFTWEHDAHLFFKRAKTTELLLGGAGGLRRRVYENAGLGAD